MNKPTRHAEASGGTTTPAQEKLSHLPDLPGVYLFRDEQQSILYIGKSKTLRNRVRSYFQSRQNTIYGSSSWFPASMISP